MANRVLKKEKEKVVDLTVYEGETFVEARKRFGIGHQTKDLTGQKFGHLEAIRIVGVEPYGNTVNYPMWLFYCDLCGGYVIYNSQQMRILKYTSCGCDRRVKPKSLEVRIDEGKQKLAEHNKRRTTSPQLTEEARETAIKMTNLLRCGRDEKGYDTRIFETPEKLRQAMDEYFKFVEQNAMVPQVSTFCIFCGIGMQSFRTYRQIQSEGFSEVFDWFDTMLSGWVNQLGLDRSTNPAFTIYHAKSVLGQKEDPAVIQHEISFSNAGINMSSLMNAPKEPEPIDVEFDEVD